MARPIKAGVLIFARKTFIINMRSTIVPGLLLILIASCKGRDKDDVTDTVNRAGSVETAVSVQHADSTHDVLLTTHKVWVNFHEFKTIVYRDTIPALGTEQTTAENQDGDTKKVNVKKDYEIYITLK
jgi:hypothetical protein